MKEQNLETIIPQVPTATKNAKAIMRMVDTDEEDKKVLELVSGSWEGNDPFSVTDEQGNRFLLIDEKKLNRLTKTLVQSQEESFKLNLEKAILHQMPIDFEDVWAVAISEIQKIAKLSSSKKMVTYETMCDVVAIIKKNHPNLFFDMNSMLKATS